MIALELTAATVRLGMRLRKRAQDTARKQVLGEPLSYISMFSSMHLNSWYIPLPWLALPWDLFSKDCCCQSGYISEGHACVVRVLCQKM